MTRFSIPASALHTAVSWAARVCPQRPATPVLAGLLLDADDDLTVTGYDFDTRATVTLPCTATVPGRVLLSGRLLADVAKTARSADVHVAADPGGPVEVSAGRAEWTLPALPVEDYPQLPDIAVPAGACVAGELRRALARVLPAAAARGTLPEFLCGVRLESDGAVLTVTATDRYRLASANIPFTPHSVDDPVDSLVPAPLLDAALRAAGGDTDVVSILEDGNGFGVASDTHLVTGRQMAAEFPRWRQFVEVAGDHHALVDVPDLQQAVEQAVVALDQEAHLLLRFDADGVAVRAVGSDRRATAHAAADLSGPAWLCKVNAGWLRDALHLHGCDKVRMHFGSTPQKPIVVLGDDPDYRHVLMPVHLTQADRDAA